MNKKSIFKDGANKNLTHPKTEKGITLVALIITIIILLILAVVAIRAIQGDGILGHAKNARDKYAQAQADEKSMLTEYEMKLKNPSAVPISKTKSDEMLTKTTNTTTYDIYGNEIVVPAGFKVLIDDTTGYTENSVSVTKGVVIQDKDGNEFVWVPVPKENEKIKTNNGEVDIDLKRDTFGLIANLNSYVEDESGGSQILAFKNSVASNGGYYIARYEARTNSNGEMASISDGLVKTRINRPEAITLCDAMYETNSQFATGLMNSYAWDTAVTFIQAFEDPSYATKTTVNSTLSNRGTNVLETKDKACNIYDMASNCWEWTTETTSGGVQVFVGGACNSAETRVTARRGQINTVYGQTSFRPVLYITATP